ncbi:MAG: DUF692 domain-containing protein [Rickettsiales bacterium]|nr:DUF692 domain-containing protein [Rickettsiales bacterium]
MKLAKSPTSSNLVGVGLRSPHIPYILKNHQKVSQKIGWFEVHSENYYNTLSSSSATLLQVRKDFHISLHSVGNSLGSAQKIDLNHLTKLKQLIEVIDPFLVSDHISWGLIDGKHSNDLLPLPYSKEAVKTLSDNISIMQDFLGREILIENPSTYLAYKHSEMSEVDFINIVTKKTGCKLLLDINNIYVSAQNNAQFDPIDYLNQVDKKIVKEIHLAGHSKVQIFDGKKHQQILIDTHNDLVCDEVWSLYNHAVKRLGKIPTLLEWDQDIPEFKVFVSEAKKAKKILFNGSIKKPT